MYFLQQFNLLYMDIVILQPGAHDLQSEDLVPQYMGKTCMFPKPFIILISYISQFQN
jgi:hypothetical protein